MLAGGNSPKPVKRDGYGGKPRLDGSIGGFVKKHFSIDECCAISVCIIGMQFWQSFRSTINLEVHFEICVGELFFEDLYLVLLVFHIETYNRNIIIFL
jgi:hypothetical protein